MPPKKSPITSPVKSPVKAQTQEDTDICQTYIKMDQRERGMWGEHCRNWW